MNDEVKLRIALSILSGRKETKGPRYAQLNYRPKAIVESGPLPGPP